MNQRRKISIVSYLNSLPMLHGLKNSDLANEIEITEDNPAQCADKLKTGSVDIGLIPVAVLKDIQHIAVFSDFCIGCDGAVDSVLLVSQEPLEKIDIILLDYQSRTSVQLVQVIAKNHWYKKINYHQAKEGFEKEMQVQKNRSKSAASVDTSDWSEVKKSSDNRPAFVGYDHMSIETTLIKYRTVQAKGQSTFQVVLESTPFYAESGGQVGDIGTLTFEDGSVLEVTDTKKENKSVDTETKSSQSKVSEIGSNIVDAAKDSY